MMVLESVNKFKVKNCKCRESVLLGYLRGANSFTILHYKTLPRDLMIE